MMIVETKEVWDVATGTSVRRTGMLFPWFHQREAVTNIVAAAMSILAGDCLGRTEGEVVSETETGGSRPQGEGHLVDGDRNRGIQLPA